MKESACTIAERILREWCVNQSCEPLTWIPHPKWEDAAALAKSTISLSHDLKKEVSRSRKMRAALIEIRDLDYRGNRHASADIACKALEET